MIDERYSVKISHSAAIATFDFEKNRAEITKMQGKFWKTFGYSLLGRNFLHPEESLYLLEKGNVSIENNQSSDSKGVVSSTSDNPEATRVIFPDFYEKIISVISLPYFLVYSKLKVLSLIILDMIYFLD